MSVVLLLMGCRMEAVAPPPAAISAIKMPLAADYKRTAGTNAGICKRRTTPYILGPFTRFISLIRCLAPANLSTINNTYRMSTMMFRQMDGS